MDKKRHFGNGVQYAKYNQNISLPASLQSSYNVDVHLQIMFKAYGTRKANNGICVDLCNGLGFSRQTTKILLSNLSIIFRIGWRANYG